MSKGSYGPIGERVRYPAACCGEYSLDAVAIIGGIQIQGRASVGGNLCNASPSADTTPILIAYRASCIINGPEGERRVAVEDFCTGPGTSVLQDGEVLVAIELPAPAENSGAHYLRFIPRNEMDIAVVGVGTAVELNEEKTVFEVMSYTSCKSENSVAS